MALKIKVSLKGQDEQKQTTSRIKAGDASKNLVLRMIDELGYDRLLFEIFERMGEARSNEMLRSIARSIHVNPGDDDDEQFMGNQERFADDALPKFKKGDRVTFNENIETAEDGLDISSYNGTITSVMTGRVIAGPDTPSYGVRLDGSHLTILANENDLTHENKKAQDSSLDERFTNLIESFGPSNADDNNLLEYLIEDYKPDFDFDTLKEDEAETNDYDDDYDYDDDEWFDEVQAKEDYMHNLLQECMNIFDELNNDQKRAMIEKLEEIVE